MVGLSESKHGLLLVVLVSNGQFGLVRPVRGCPRRSGVPSGLGSERRSAMDDDRWLPVAETSVCLGIEKQTLYKWITRKPDITAHKLGRLWKFKLDEVGAWVKSGGAAPRNAEARKTDA